MSEVRIELAAQGLEPVYPVQHAHNFDNINLLGASTMTSKLANVLHRIELVAKLC